MLGPARAPRRKSLFGDISTAIFTAFVPHFTFLFVRESDYSVPPYLCNGIMPCMLPHIHSHTRAHMHPHAGCACWHSLTAVCSTQRPRNSHVHGGTVLVRTHDMCGPALFLYMSLFNCARERAHALLRRARAAARGVPRRRLGRAQDLCGSLHVVALSAGHCNAAQLSLLTLREWHRNRNC